MRIIVASPPKTGNIWIKSILSKMYGLEVITPEPKDDVRDLQNFIEEGKFVRDSIFHQHYWPTELYFNLMDSIEGQTVTILRNPYDCFVSLFYYVQNFPELFSESHPLYFMLEKDISHPEVLDFIGKVEGGFGIHIVLGNQWLESGKSLLTRYEDMKKDAFSEIRRIADQIQSVSDRQIRQAIKDCSAKRMRKQNEILARHIRKAKPGDWKNHLSEDHLRIFREKYGDKISKLGYEVK